MVTSSPSSGSAFAHQCRACGRIYRAPSPAFYSSIPSAHCPILDHCFPSSLHLHSPLASVIARLDPLHAGHPLHKHHHYQNRPAFVEAPLDQPRNSVDKETRPTARHHGQQAVPLRQVQPRSRGPVPFAADQPARHAAPARGEATGAAGRTRPLHEPQREGTGGLRCPQAGFSHLVIAATPPPDLVTLKSGLVVCRTARNLHCKSARARSLASALHQTQSPYLPT